MQKSHKVWLRTAGIVSICFASLIVFGSLCILFNFFNAQRIFDDFVHNLIKNMTYKHDFDFVRFVVVGEMLLACFLNIYSAYIQLSLAKRNYIVVGSSRVLINVAIFQFLFTANIFSATISLVVATRLNRSVWANRGTAKLSVLAHEVEKLRILRDKGVISEEKWNEEFNALLEKYSTSRKSDKF